MATSYMYSFRIHYPRPHSIGPATELKTIAAPDLKTAKEYAKNRAVELNGRLVEIYKMEGK
jgi:hypothetical protein